MFPTSPSPCSPYSDVTTEAAVKSRIADLEYEITQTRWYSWIERDYLKGEVRRWKDVLARNGFEMPERKK